MANVRVTRSTTNKRKEQLLDNEEGSIDINRTESAFKPPTQVHSNSRPIDCEGRIIRSFSLSNNIYATQLLENPQGDSTAQSPPKPTPFPTMPTLARSPQARHSMSGNSFTGDPNETVEHPCPPNTTAVPGPPPGRTTPILGEKNTDDGPPEPIVTPMDTDTPEESERKAQDDAHRLQREHLLKTLRENQQIYNLPGSSRPNASGSGNAIGTIFNHLNLHQKQHYNVVWNLNRVEAAGNSNKLKIAGHGIDDLRNKDECFKWWQWLLHELEAPPELKAVGRSFINFTSGSADQKPNGERGQGRILFIEFPNSEITNWILSFGIRLCRKVQSYEGLERLSINPMLTDYEIKVNQYSHGIMVRLRENINGPASEMVTGLQRDTRVRGIGRLRQHIVLIGANGKRFRTFYYNLLLTDDMIKPFLPTSEGVIQMPPTDLSYAPQDMPLLEIDYEVEALVAGSELYGKREGINMKVPDYISPSIHKKLNPGYSHQQNFRGLRGANATALGTGRGSHNQGPREHSDDNRRNETNNYKWGRGRGRKEYSRGRGRDDSRASSNNREDTANPYNTFYSKYYKNGTSSKGKGGGGSSSNYDQRDSRKPWNKRNEDEVFGPNKATKPWNNQHGSQDRSPHNGSHTVNRNANWNNDAGSSKVKPWMRESSNEARDNPAMGGSGQPSTSNEYNDNGGYVNDGQNNYY